MNFRNPGVWGISLALALLLAFMSALLGYSRFGTCLNAADAAIVEVRPGEGFSTMAHRLEREGTLRYSRLLAVLAMVRGDTGRIKAGEYVFHGEVTPGRFLDALVAGKGEFSALTIPEGYSLKDIAARIEEDRLGNASEFLRLTQDPAFIASLDLPLKPAPATLEGLIFPDTYFLYRGVSVRSLISAMVRQFKTKAWPVLTDGAATRRMTPYQVLILSSIIEKETGVESERPLVSAVFHNRLRQGIKLASDPTVIYGVQDFDGNLTRAHLRTPTPYNTYTNSGLPPTPIASPGLASVRAALAPATVPYLYFVSRGDGTHQFSNDYRTHEQAVDRYQRRQRRRA
jgi:UPF0755 protein